MGQSSSRFEYPYYPQPYGAQNFQPLLYGSYPQPPGPAPYSNPYNYYSGSRRMRKAMMAGLQPQMFMPPGQPFGFPGAYPGLPQGANYPVAYPVVLPGQTTAYPSNPYYPQHEQFVRIAQALQNLNLAAAPQNPNMPGLTVAPAMRMPSPQFNPPNPMDRDPMMPPMRMPSPQFNPPNPMDRDPVIPPMRMPSPQFNPPNPMDRDPVIPMRMPSPQFGPPNPMDRDPAMRMPSPQIPMSMPEPQLPHQAPPPPPPMMDSMSPEPMFAPQAEPRRDTYEFRHNPLPEPPRDIEIPAHLISDTAITFSSMPAHTHGHMNMSRRDRDHRGRKYELQHPLPELPLDVYDTRRYHELREGVNERIGAPYRVHPSGWEQGRHGREREGGSSGLAYSLSHFAKRVGSIFKPRHADEPYGHSRRRHGQSSSYPPPGFIPTVPPPNMMSPPVIPGPGGPGGPAFMTQTPPFLPPPGSQMMGMGPLPPLAGLPPGIPGAPSSSEPVHFDIMTQNTGFTHVSPHKILYKKKLYPTALHLLEAMKFLGRRNDLAERVRLTERVPDLLALTEELEGQVRRDWPDIMESKMEEVLYMKFRQHPDLRQLLMETNDAELIYDEEGDSFWGVGVQGQGANRLGQALHNVRERLRREGAGRSFGLGRG